MGKVYTASVLTGTPIAGGFVFGLWAPTRRTLLREIQIPANATASLFLALYRTTARGTATATNGEAEDGGNEAPTSQLDSAYTVDPTIPGNKMMQFATGILIGRFIVLEFQDLFWIEIGNGIAVRNLPGSATAAGHETTCMWEE